MITDLQKASLWKRISAALFDFIILVVVVVGMIAGLSAVLHYDDHARTLADAYERYGDAYGVTMPITEEEFDAMSDAEQNNYNAAKEAINADEDARHAAAMIQHLPLLMITFGVLLGILLLEIIFPLMFGNGQTLGKKIFGVALMRIDGVKITPLQLLVRSALGKFTVELMIPIYCVFLFLIGKFSLMSLALVFIVLLAQILCLIMTRTWSLLHDVMAGTVAVDLASQMIFESNEERLEYIQKIHAQEAADAAY